MLRENGRRVRFHDIVAGKAYQTIAIGQKRGRGSQDEFRIVDRGVRHPLGRLKSEQRQCHKVKRDAGSHDRYYLTALGIASVVTSHVKVPGVDRPGVSVLDNRSQRLRPAEGRDERRSSAPIMIADAGSDVSKSEAENVSHSAIMAVHSRRLVAPANLRVFWVLEHVATKRMRETQDRQTGGRSLPR